MDDLSLFNDIIPRLERVVNDDASCDAPKLGYHTRHVQIELPNGMTPFSPRACGWTGIAKGANRHEGREGREGARRELLRM